MKSVLRQKSKEQILSKIISKFPDKSFKKWIMITTVLKMTLHYAVIKIEDKS